MYGPEPATIPLSTDAVRANLLRLEQEWEMVQESHDRDAIYGYLTAVRACRVLGEGGKGGQTCLSSVIPATAFFGKRARTICRCDPLHGRSWQAR